MCRRRPAHFDYAAPALLSSPVRPANLRCNTVQLLVSRGPAGENHISRHISVQHYYYYYFYFFCVGQTPRSHYAWNGAGETGVEMLRRTSSPQQEPWPAYIASKSVTSCFIPYEFARVMSNIFWDTDEKWRQHTRRRTQLALQTVVYGKPLHLGFFDGAGEHCSQHCTPKSERG